MLAFVDMPVYLSAAAAVCQQKQQQQQQQQQQKEYLHLSISFPRLKVTNQIVFVTK